MAHPEMHAYLEKIKQEHPEHFWRVRVFDGGSLDLNGSNASLWNYECGYTGVDLAPGKNVNIVMAIEDADWSDGHFHVVISTECFEHNPKWREGLKNMIRMLRPGGLLIVTAAKDPRKKHGTPSNNQQDSPFTESGYYRNLTEADLREVIDPSEFSHIEFESNNNPGDLYFHAVKKGILIHGCTCDETLGGINGDQKPWMKFD